MWHFQLSSHLSSYSIVCLFNGKYGVNQSLELPCPVTELVAHQFRCGQLWQILRSVMIKVKESQWQVPPFGCGYKIMFFPPTGICMCESNFLSAAIVENWTSVNICEHLPIKGMRHRWKLMIERNPTFRSITIAIGSNNKGQEPETAYDKRSMLRQYCVM